MLVTVCSNARAPATRSASIGRPDDLAVVSGLAAAAVGVREQLGVAVGVAVEGSRAASTSMRSNCRSGETSVRYAQSDV